jgi:hypothetical protein
VALRWAATAPCQQLPSHRGRRPPTTAPDTVIACAGIGGRAVGETLSHTDKGDGTNHRRQHGVYLGEEER